jgi:predicted rRNA methylase YqxC with S4 and FtsJ domains
MAPKSPPKKKLIDRLVSEGISPSREVAEKQIRAGLVRVEGATVDKPGTLVSVESQITLSPRKDFVGRGALKLSGALMLGPVQVDSRRCSYFAALRRCTLLMWDMEISIGRFARIHEWW